jgi:hypothetical protein
MNCLKCFFIAGHIVTWKKYKRMQASEIISVSNYCLKIDTYGTVQSGSLVQPFSENNSTLLKSMVKKKINQHNRVMPEKIIVNKTLDKSSPLFCAHHNATAFMSGRINPVHIPPCFFKILFLLLPTTPIFIKSSFRSSVSCHNLTFWHRNFILHTLYIKCKNTGPKKR